jgi:hypothetical protein
LKTGITVDSRVINGSESQLQGQQKAAFRMKQFKCDGMNCASWTTVPDTMSKTSFCGIELIPGRKVSEGPQRTNLHRILRVALRAFKIPSLNIPLLLGFISSHFISSAIRSTSIAALIDVDGKRC